MAKSTRSNFFKATEITEDNEWRQYIYDLTNDLNTSADNLNTEIHDTAQKLILNFQIES